MNHPPPTRVVARRAHFSPLACFPAPPDGQGAPAESEVAVPKLGIAVYGCEPEEATLFREMAPRFGVLPAITDSAVSESNSDLASGSRCVSVGHKTPLAAPTLAALRQAGVRYISTRSVGYNHIDLPCAKRLGIVVENVAYSPDSVADYTLMLMLMALRRAKSVLHRAQAHDYRSDGRRGRELRDLTVGVIGTGRIGAAVLERLGGFGCRVLAYDRCPTTSAIYVPLDELFERSDIITLHTPLTPDTHHLLDRRRIDAMKDGAFVVNTGRGALVDTDALLDALGSGRLGGAALDVLEDEEGIFYFDRRQAPVESQRFMRLHQLPNVIITPHTAYYTDHALGDIVENTLSNCLRFEKGAAWIA